MTSDTLSRAPNPVTGSLRGKRILIVDDDPDIQGLVLVLLKRVGLEASAVGDANEAAQALRSGSLPDLLILDLMLPGISGIEFLQQLRARPVFDRLPVLVLSALIDPEQIREALDAGADRYITKPYIANNLTTVVADLLRAGRRAPSS